MYLVGGAITIIWSVVILFFMPPDPIRARCLNERERYIAVARLRVNNSGVRNTHFKKEQVFELLVDVKFWVMFAMAFLIMIANGPVSTFTPIIIAGFGYNTLNSLLLVMPAGAIIGSVGTLAHTLIPKYHSAVLFIKTPQGVARFPGAISARVFALAAGLLGSKNPHRSSRGWARSSKTQKMAPTIADPYLS